MVTKPIPESWPLRPTCSERGCDCHPHESEEDFRSWVESGLCLRCAEKLYQEYESDLRGIA